MVTKPDKWLKCKNLDQWTDWLDKNHQKKDMVWLEIKKAKSRIQGIRLDEAVIEAIRFGWIDGQMFSIDDDRFIIRLTPRRKNSIWSLKNRQRAQMLIDQGQMKPAGMSEVELAHENGMWEQAYSALDDIEVPDDLAKKLKANRVQYEKFIKLSNSKQLQLIHWLNQAKTPATRKKRIDKILENLITDNAKKKPGKSKLNK